MSNPRYKRPMASIMNPAAVGRLERSCGWIRTAPSCRGFERVEACFCGHAFDPHRHDTYALGFTIAGVQSFRYRGASQHSLPGQSFVLHPDETHDDAAGTPAGFRYRIAYVEPGLILDALAERRAPLPFVRESVSSNRRLARVLQAALGDLDSPLEELQRDQIIVELADALSSCDLSIRRRTISARHWRAVGKARELLDSNLDDGPRSAELEALTGLTRYDLARHFRACLGTSPYRYLVMRRLDRVRALIGEGTPLADAALAAGFADQSHMTRHFKKVYGMSPGRWAMITKGR
jgi:AraC-like DNA-binding protein